MANDETLSAAEDQEEHDEYQEELREALQNDLETIGAVALDEEDRLLSFDDFCRVYMCIQKHVEPRLKASLDHLKKGRRRALANIDLETYR